MEAIIPCYPATWAKQLLKALCLRLPVFQGTKPGPEIYLTAYLF
ncbi:hypothetical protein [Parapedobacter defluvii]|nr:hypothetical protein [Parapedobacter defluvii]